MANTQHEAVKSFSWLIGKWIGKHGKGSYPTIKSFDFAEQVDITHPASNQPVLHLKYHTTIFSNIFDNFFHEKKLIFSFIH
jgi:hypothetical protein